MEHNKNAINSCKIDVEVHGMRINTIRKAIMFYYAGEVTFISERERVLWFKVKDYDIRMSFSPMMEFTCTCKACSLHSNKSPLCSHKLACIFFLEAKERTQMMKKGIV